MGVRGGLFGEDPTAGRKGETGFAMAASRRPEQGCP